MFQLLREDDRPRPPPPPSLVSSWRFTVGLRVQVQVQTHCSRRQVSPGHSQTDVAAAASAHLDRTYSSGKLRTAKK